MLPSVRPFGDLGILMGILILLWLLCQQPVIESPDVLKRINVNSDDQYLEVVRSNREAVKAEL